jgi:hypothetical protein
MLKINLKVDRRTQTYTGMYLLSLPKSRRFSGGARMRRRPRRRCAYNVLRVYEPEVRARRLRSCSSAAAVTERRVAEGTFADLRQQAGAALAPFILTSSKRRDRGKRAVRPSDERSEERCVNPLLGACGRFGFNPKDQ